MDAWEDYGLPELESTYEVEGFDWDLAKAEANLAKGLSFEEASTCWDYEPDFERPGNRVGGEQRWLRYGWSCQGRRLAVVYVRTSEKRVRIISARLSPRGSG